MFNLSFVPVRNTESMRPDPFIPFALGLDIGGANIKAANSDGFCICRAFEIWKNKDGLVNELRQLSALTARKPDVIGLTMTAELADCFDSKSEGVEFIVRMVAAAFPETVIRTWMTSGEFADPQDAIELPDLVAAANWHALATWAGRGVPTGTALLVDVGSTTTDLIPLLDGVPCPEGRTDLQRLMHSELIYSGIRRTPLCSIVREVPLLDETSAAEFGRASVWRVPVAAELFATTLDIHLINGDISEDISDLNTADNRPATRSAAMNRLAHLVCCDRNDLSDAQLQHIARDIADQQLRILAAAMLDRIRYVSGLSGTRPEAVQLLLSGSGDWLAKHALRKSGHEPELPPIQLSTMFVRNISESACAFAVARLASERCCDDLLSVSDLYS